MKVRARFFAYYRELLGLGQVELELSDGTVGKLWESLVRRYPALSGQRPAIAVNGEFAGAETTLSDGDEVAFLPPFSGGQTAVRLTYDVLDPEAIALPLVTEEQGALVVFQGVVRRWNEGRRVLYLEYEAYEPMARAKMEEVCAEMRSRWGVEAAMHHRLGRMEIGEVSLVVAVASPHRKEAFEACQYAVDRIKEIVPIWKKEVFEGGATWVGHQGTTP